MQDFNFIRGRESEAADAISDAWVMRAGISLAKPHPAARDLLFTTPADVARASLEHAGVSTRDLSGEPLTDSRLMSRAIEIGREMASRGAGLGTTDLNSIAANAAGKALLAGFASAQTTWRKIVRVISLDTFRRTTLVGVSEVPLLQPIGENGEIHAATQTDVEEYITAAARGIRVNLTREAMVGNDMSLLLAGPFAAGLAADRTLNAAVYSLLTSNGGIGPTLNQDSTALFHANHNNYDASSGAPSVSTLDTERKAMRRQADPTTGRRLNIAPKYIVAPPSLESVVRVLCAADRIEGNADNLEPLVEAALEDGTNGATAWYLAADPQLYDGLVVGAIDGVLEPRLTMRPGWSTDGLDARVTMDFGVAAVGYRGWYRRKGA